MSSTFIALPLSSGEAFLLRTQDDAGRDWTILIDGGKKYGEASRELARIISEVNPKIDRIDIAICTHSDADHSNGFWFLAEDWYELGGTIGEFWLPGRWANAMPTILVDPTGFAAKLWEGAREAAETSFMARREGSQLLREASFNLRSEDRVDDYAVDPIDSGGDDRPFGSAFGLSEDELRIFRADNDETDDAIDVLKTALVAFEDPKWHFIDAIRTERDLRPAVFSERSVAFAEVAETAEAIRKIAISAIEHRIKVRWFDFGTYKTQGKPSGGIKGLLEPLCAVEVQPVRTKAMALSSVSLFNSLRLSRQNVESLVFYRPETSKSPGVMLLGDSRLAHGIERPEGDFPIPFEKPNRSILVTAPHHGSDNNDHAFGVLNAWLGSQGPYFVRNGGQSNQSLGAFCKQLERRCAQCVQCHNKNWRQPVEVHANGANWNWPPSANPCGTPKP